MPQARIAVIGGSGLYQIDQLRNVREVSVETPFGRPSDVITVGDLEGEAVAFLPRHGVGHRIAPSELPVKANIYALKSLGVERIIAVSAVGSMKEDIRPLDLVVPDQIFDRTKVRSGTFFGDGVVAHIGFADPFCPDLSALLYDAIVASGARVHRGGTYVCIEGPQFSTKAESRIYRSWGVDIIGMTAIPEAKLAREAEICYATMALVTDYDVWHESEEIVTMEMVLANLLKNVALAKRVIQRLVASVPAERECACGHALENAIATHVDRISDDACSRLDLLIGKYLRK